MPFIAEYTDTFGGEPNYAWVRRAVIADTDNGKLAMRRARAKLGLTGMRGRITADWGDQIHWVPAGCCTILMLTYCDSEKAARFNR